MIALNANCSKVSCSSTSAQVKWLKADLAAHPRACTLAYYHYPRYYSNGQRSSLGTIWNELSRHRVDVVLAAHHHYYERFAPMDASGSYDPVNGIRQFIVGTGGKSRSSLPSTVNPNSEERDNTTYGVLKLTLGATGYDWKFVPEVGKTYSDSGSGTCSRDTSPPSAPQGLKATASSPTKVDLSWTALAPGRPLWETGP